MTDETTQTEPTPAQKILAAAAELGITMTTEFIPMSQSRNNDDKRLTLNWRVTLHRAGKAFITTDFSAGAGYAPFYKKVKNHSKIRVWESDALRAECEKGLTCVRAPIDPQTGEGFFDRTRPILPDFESVLQALVRDCDALNHPNFESWASEYGANVDSRKEEAIYRACLETSLKMHATLGDAGIEKLAEACQDY